jgi:Flp pilus assembly protein TadB
MTAVVAGALVLVVAARWRPAVARPAATPTGPPTRRPVPYRWLLAAGAAAVLAMAPPVGAALLLAVGCVPRWRGAQAVRSHRRAVRDGLPDLVALVEVALQAGLTPALAVERLAVHAPPPFDAALAEVLARTRRGVRGVDALAALPELLGDDLHPLVETLSAGERYGVPIGPSLSLLAHDARLHRRRQAETEARRLPVLLSFPLVLCLLPSFVLLALAPLVAGALAGLSP